LKLLVKFNLLLIVVFGLGLFVIAYQARSFLQEQAQAEVLRQAGLMAASASATRNYTEHYITSIIEKTTEHTNTFLPQAIPFFASTTTFDQIRQTYPDYTYKEAALNPTNLRDRATDWEADMINFFRNSPKETELVRLREGATGPTLALAHPIRVESGGLQCHSTPEAAPKALIKHYGSQNGFGWNLNEVIGAQVISIPTSVPIKLAQQGLTRLLINLAAIFLAAILLIDIGLYFIVIRRLGMISHYADRISQGEMDLEQLPVSGNDEVAPECEFVPAAHTPADRSQFFGIHFRPRFQIFRGGNEIADRPIFRKAAHEFMRHFGIRGDFPPVEVDRQRHVSSGGEFLRLILGPILQSQIFVNHDDPGKGPFSLRNEDFCADGVLSARIVDGR